MIDFRYHLVSLISVFLALAVGIVLGAGPLKESIGTTLTKEVDDLRQQKTDLKGQLATSETASTHRDAFITSVTPSLVSGQLTGRSVAIVTLPGVDSDAVDPLVNAITAAGGTVTGRVGISSGWVDPNQEAARVKVLGTLATELPNEHTTGETDDRLAGLLSDALVGNGGLGGIPASSATVLKSLRSANLISIKGDVASLAGAALVLAPANADLNDQGVTPTGSSAPESAYITLATDLDTVGGGAVVTGPASAASGGGVVAAIRDNDTASKNISTVDSGSTPMGVITAVLALREQLAGGVGAYGFVGDGTKQLPALVSDATGSTPAPTNTGTKK
jgi:hypothetical protein